MWKLAMGLTTEYKKRRFGLAKVAVWFAGLVLFATLIVKDQT